MNWRQVWAALLRTSRAFQPSGFLQPVSERHIDVTMSDGGTLRLLFSPECSEADYWRALRWAEEGPWTTSR